MINKFELTYSVLRVQAYSKLLLTAENEQDFNYFKIMLSKSSVEILNFVPAYAKEEEQTEIALAVDISEAKSE